MSAAGPEGGAGRSLETPLARVRGLGAKGEGGEHWWQERVSAIATLLLTVWLGASLALLPALDFATVRDWLASPFAAVPMLLFIAAAFWHLVMGLVVVIEDYVHEPGNKFFALLLVKFAGLFAAALAMFAVLKIALSGDAA